MADRFSHFNIHFPLVRPQTKSRWRECFQAVEEGLSTNHKKGMPSFLTTDHNEWSGGWHDPHPQFKKLGGKGIDLIGYVPAPDYKLQVVSRKTINLTIDRHDAEAVKVELTLPSGKQITFWVVQANLGRGAPPSEFVANAEKMRKSVKGKVSFGLDEIDEADQPQEHERLGDVFPRPQYELAGWGTTSPIVSKGLDIRRVRVTQACSGLAEWTPHRPLVEAVIAVP